jgi:hypothetical protein
MQHAAALFRADTTAWGCRLEAAARVLAPLLVLAWVIAADLVVLTYRAGRALGAAIHHRNNQLAAAARQVLAPERPQPAPVVPAIVQPIPQALPALEELTQRQLMVLAGTRRKLAKRQLIAMLATA